MQVDDKYQYSMESQDIRVHGFISKNPPTGFWQITPSYEFRSGGPNKQFLTSHVGPSVLAVSSTVLPRYNYNYNEFCFYEISKDPNIDRLRSKYNEHIFLFLRDNYERHMIVYLIISSNLRDNLFKSRKFSNYDLIT